MKPDDTPRNPLLSKAAGPACPATNPTNIRAKTSLTLRDKPRDQLLQLFRKQSAAEAIAALDPTTTIFGLTKGQFSLINLIEAALDKTGPAALTLSTWTAAHADLRDLRSLVDSDRLTSARFLLDFTFQRRQPGTAAAIREAFGANAVRVTRNHAKFFLLHAPPSWHLTCKTSMNLNQNPRIEDFDITNDPALYTFLDAIVSDLFAQMKTDQTELPTSTLQTQFRNLESVK